MGQGANSGRHASLDDKKERAAGRKQNNPAVEAITGREEAPPVAGAFGGQGVANRRGSVSFVAGDTSGGTGGPISKGKSTRPARKRKG
ncbi:MAG: hypothetical protein JWN40_2 [Phycisphaerales bacterium]|nr:hypothetical protein [Phycisphaerales bacterium]